MSHCPEYEAEIALQGLLMGENIYCPDCNAELEVLRLDPPEVALAPHVFFLSSQPKAEMNKFRFWHLLTKCSLLWFNIFSNIKYSF